MWDISWLEKFPKTYFETGEQIIKIDEPINYNYYLAKGVCAKVVYSPEGESLILHYYNPGKMLGLHLHRYGEKSTIDFVAKSPCVCYKIPYNETQNMLIKDNKLCYDILQECLDEYDFFITASLANIFGGGLSVLCFYLKLLAQKDEDGTYIVPLIYTNTELSHLCGVHPVSISRMLNHLKVSKVIERNEKGICISNMDVLENYIKTDE